MSDVFEIGYKAFIGFARMCMHMRTPLLLALVLYGSSAVAESLRATCENGLVLNANVEAEVRDFHFWENFTLSGSFPHVRAEVSIENSADVAVPFSTSMVRLSASGIDGKRAYSRTISPGKIDWGTITLAAGKQMQIKVYWPVSLKIGAHVERASLTCVAD